MRVETIERKLFTFEELESDAQEKALEWMREGACQDSHWYEFVYDDADSVFKILGIDSRKPVKLMNGSTRYEPAIWFSGFCSQGDGACFEGSYSYKPGALKAIKEHAPQDETLHDIAERLTRLQRRYFYKLTAEVTHYGRYYHEHSASIQVEDSRDSYRDIKPEDESELQDCLRDLMRWIYSQLETEYEFQNSDETLKENILANGYEFTADGVVA